MAVILTLWPKTLFSKDWSSLFRDAIGCASGPGVPAVSKYGVIRRLTPGLASKAWGDDFLSGRTEGRMCALIGRAILNRMLRIANPALLFVWESKLSLTIS